VSRLVGSLDTQSTMGLHVRMAKARYAKHAHLCIKAHIGAWTVGAWTVGAWTVGA